MKIIFKSNLIALVLSASSFTSSNATLPLASDVADHVDEFMKHRTLYSERDNKKYSLVQLKWGEISGTVTEKTVVRLDNIPLSPKYYQTFPWIGKYQTYVVQKAGDTTLYYLTIAEVLKNGMDESVDN